VTNILQLHPVLKADFVRAEGSTLYDSQGRGFLDWESGVWCTGLGHGHPRITEVLHRQAGRLMHLGFRYQSPVTEEAAAELLDLAGLAGGRCVFLTSGSEAVNLALHLARPATRKTRFVCLDPTFLASYGQGADQSGTRCTHVDRDATGLDPVMDWDPVSAFVLEPGSACGSVQFPCEGLVGRIADRVQGRGGLVVVDEVVTGLGRSGEWFGFNHFDVRPDIVALGKGLGNGYPVSAVLVSQQVARALSATDLHYIQSHQNDPLGCAVALEVVRTLRQEGLVERSRQVGRLLLDRLTDLQTRCPALKEVRGRGLMVAAELQERIAADRVFDRMLDRGFLIGCSPTFNLVRFMPPLNVPLQEIDRLLDGLEAVLHEVAGSAQGPRRSTWPEGS